jgi:hypothetical protein
MKQGTWPRQGAEQVKRLLEPLIAVIRHGEGEPPVRPHVFKIVDEHGNEREVFAPPGHVTRWPW